METSGPSGGVEALLRFAYGDATYEALDGGVRERLSKNAEVFLTIESSLFGYRPSDASLAAVELPVHVLTAAEGPNGGPPVAFFGEIAQWIASRLSVTDTVSGRHGDYIDRPQAMADELRPLLRATD